MKNTRENSRFCVEYWIKRGFSESDARSKISEIQKYNSKFQTGKKKFSEEDKARLSQIHKHHNSLEYFLEKYGNDGHEKYKIYKENQRLSMRKAYEAKIQSNFNFKESSMRCKEYWMKRGFSEDEAIRMVSLTQSRSLSFYEKKYGQQEGLQRWLKHKKKWYESFYNDSRNHNVLNEKRRINSHCGLYTENTIKNIKDLYFYVFVFVDSNGKEVLKYGLTKQDSLFKRWKMDYVYKIVYFEKMKSENAVKLEKTIKQKLQNKYVPEKVKTTECCLFTEENLNVIQTEVNNVV